MKSRNPVKAQYEAVLAAPFGRIGILLTDDKDKLHGIDLLPEDHPVQAATSLLAHRVAHALNHYFDNPKSNFDLPLAVFGTPYQTKVWHALTAIPLGQTTTYGQLAHLLGSSPRAVGQACGANPLPIIIPCHRVVASNGRGGFMHAASGAPLTYKDWLLDHESGIATSA